MLNRSAVFTLLFFALIVMIGALPVVSSGDPKSSIPVGIFSSPVFVLLMIWLSVSCIVCCLRGGFSLRRIGFILTHLGVAVLLGGAIWGGISERKMNVVVMIGEGGFTDRLSLTQRQSRLRLPFSISVAEVTPVPEYVFHVPDKSSMAGYKMAGRFIPAKDGIDLGEAGRVGMDRLHSGGNTWAPRVVLASGAFLQQVRSSSMFCRAIMHFEGDGIPAVDAEMTQGDVKTFEGVSVQLDGLDWLSESEAMVKLKVKTRGSEVWESAYISPSPNVKSDSPILTHLSLPFSVAVNSFRVEHFDPSSYALYDPPGDGEREGEYLGTYTPGAKGMSMGAYGDVPPARLRSEDGELVEQVILADQRVLKLLPGSDKYYEAEFAVSENGDDGKPETHNFIMAVNKPVTYGGWRFYLLSYDREHPRPRYLTLTARSDPGRNLVIAGIWMLIIGTFMICLMRRGKRHVV